MNATNTRYTQDQEQLASALKLTPGASQTSSKAPGRVGPLGAFPLFLHRGAGPYVWSDHFESTRYVDWFNGNCAVTLGHAHSAVNSQIAWQLSMGALLSLPSPLETAVAHRLVALIPCAEQIRFVKTGSEACAGAVRIARMATGRDVIVCVSGQYHGWHDWHCVTKAEHPGVPAFMAQGVRTFAYNDLESLRAVMGSDVAAVMLEPTLATAPAPGFLEGVQAIAREFGALLIFDEMITGARWSLGGAQQVYGVTPDLATFGKAYANGVAFAFIAGSAALMVHAWPISGTFSSEALGLAACLGVLDVHRQRAREGRDPIGRMHDVGRLLKAAVNGYTSSLALPFALVGPDVRPVWDWSSVPTDERRLVVSLLQQELAAAGVLVHPSGWNTSAAHDATAMDETLLATMRALVAVKGYLDRDPADRLACLRGELIREGTVRPS